MRLLISDANILIDMEAGALMETLFRLPMQFGIPDLLYYEEIEEGSPGLEQLGLKIMEVSGVPGVNYFGRSTSIILAGGSEA